MPSNIPRMRALMEDPLYRAYVRRIPAAPVASDRPWQLWVDRGEGRWSTALYDTYRDAWGVFIKYFRAGDGDPTLTSRRSFYAPPGEWYKQKVRKPRRPTPDNKATSHIVVEDRWRQTFVWDGTDLHWCGRCRRPSYWMPLFASHHALRRFPAISTEDNYRCIICGIRWIAQPSIADMLQIEAMP